MTTISFLTSMSVEDLSEIATSTVMDEADHDIDSTLDALNVLQESQESLSDVMLSAESIDQPTEREMCLLYQAADIAVRPIGLSISTESLSMELQQDGFIARVKETIKRIWNAIKRTIGKIWEFMKRHFGKVYAQHRLLQKDIDRLRIAMDQKKRLLPTNPTVKTIEALSVLGGVGAITTSGNQPNVALRVPASYSMLKRSLDDFVVARKGICEDYSRLLAAAINMLIDQAKDQPSKFFDIDTLAESQDKLAKVYNLLSISRVVSVLKGLPVTTASNDLAIQTFPGGYELKVEERIASKGDLHYRKIHVDLSKNPQAVFEQTDIANYSMLQIKELLDIAEKLKNELMRSTMRKRVDYLERATESYQKAVDGFQNYFDKYDASALPQETVTHTAATIRFQAEACADFSAWSSGIFMKVETLTLRIAIAIAHLCKLQLANYA